MTMASSRAPRRYATVICCIPALTIITMASLRGDERQSNPPRQPPTDAGSTAAAGATETNNVGQVETDPSPDAVEPKLDGVSVEAVWGTPFSIGVIELKFADGHGPVHYPDQPLFLEASGQRAHYATFDSSYQEQAGKPSMQLDRLRGLFLLRGNQLSHVSLGGLAGIELEKQKVPVVEDPARHRRLLQEWWTKFSVVPDELAREQKMLKRSLLGMLARRLGIPGPWPIAPAVDSAEANGLEKQFERAIGMLFGIKSVELAVQEDVTLNQSRDREEADQRVPERPRMRSLNVPPVPLSTRVEPIAMHVPAECFYLRTGSLANYRYFRRFLLGWGGSLKDIVATRSLDHQTRSKIELQLGLQPDQVSAREFDESITDMALIGCDPFFQDGAAIGVLFQSRQSESLFRLIQEQRQQVKRHVPEAMERRVEIANHAVSFLSSDDNRVRSFYAIDGKYHLVTNSRYLLNRFFEAGRGDRSLGALAEFRYACSKTDMQRRPLAFLYLSDPFFQNLVSPQYRIELTRRRLAAQELKQFHLARLVTNAEQLDAVTVAQLIEKRLLPPEFASRPDKSVPLIKDGKLRDSLRGSPEAFLPVPDVPLEGATRTEVHSYQQFVRRYNQEWRRVDPVTVVFSRNESATQDHDWVSLDIVITPYAENHYSLLRRHLASANTRRVAPVDGDLLGLDTSIRSGPGGPPHLLYLGLRDGNIPFALENGNLRLLDRPQQSSYAESHSYAAISPPSTDLLRLLASVFDRQPGEQSPIAPPARQANLVPPPAILAPPTVTQVFFYAGWAMGKLWINYGDLFHYMTSVETHDDWTVVSSNNEMRKSTFAKLTKEYTEAAPQVRLRMKSLRGAEVEPYIQAHTYLAARRVSSENARFLNDFAQWTQLSATDARETVENLLNARICCPLGGDFEVKGGSEDPRWVGTDWSEASVHAVSATPESWRFPFLDWIRRLDLRFDLGRSTLRAQVDLLVHQDNAPAFDGKTVGLQNLNPPTALAVTDHDVIAAKPPLTSRSPTAPGAAITTARSSVPPPVPDELSPLLRAASEPRDSTASRTWVLGVRLTSADQSMRITDVYPDSPASRAGLRLGDTIQTVDRQRPRSHSQLVQLLRAALERDGVAVVQILRRGVIHRFRIPLLDR